MLLACHAIVCLPDTDIDSLRYLSTATSAEWIFESNETQAAAAAVSTTVATGATSLPKKRLYNQAKPLAA